MECGCQITAPQGDNIVEFCPLHAAAPEYAAAAELAIACMAMEGDHANHDAPCWLDALTLAHAKAT